MCGIAGFIDFAGRLGKPDLRSMVASLRHRGPDDEDALVIDGPATRVGLGHARLSILDLTEAGRQPMRHEQLSIVFNGEIYNYREIRKELIARGHAFHTDSDTEVILHSFAEWGVRCLDLFIGMFAFVLHDARSEQVYFVRDRVGVKPLYVYQSTDAWLFASELKALRANKVFSAQLSQSGLRSFFENGYVADDDCIYENCNKVDAGTYWVLSLRTRRCERVRWWNYACLHQAPKLTIGFDDAADELEALLKSACEYRMVADVPVGVFLSGGYDSTAVVSLLQSASSSQIKTFTIGFTEGNDEAPSARATASFLGTDHHELYCSPADALHTISQLPEVYDEPFADSSAIPTLLVSRLARSRVKVALSADGGDELFCGYDSYPITARRIARMGQIPSALRGPIGESLRLATNLFPKSAHALRHRLLGIGESLAASNVQMAQRLHERSRKMPQSMLNQLLPGDRESRMETRGGWPDGADPMEAAMGLDYQTYLKDDILTKVDRATMSVGLEGREPFLDHRVAQFAARLPLSYKFDGLTTKRILKHIVHRHVPKEMMARPKAGFSLPIMKWLRDELSELFSETCSADQLRVSEFLDPRVVESWIKSFQGGRFHYSPLIWRIFMYQLWANRWLTKSAMTRQ
ncbi:MAG: asparagine synthase (glutamine-hydrolyzing) [Arenimonas sp. SCN 70-307]|uniref:asparagine synthase (glutamine-hydrolyzing) n=1 Tax=Arenimonas sp. SCN 70-307 TaxID=1660089 RepID=UPI00086F382A|nr:asparagine synthase (glutamine-hydrolyzing) [Arenimonas sp. SCN 70-307]ODS62989.1 MAG: asparagine synthase (glutamine-hydrolyzing) [Arenimonas sp. SCN 70-307]